MGVREKTEFNLQTVCLVSAVGIILFFWAARHYTTDWRERRIFRRRLADTHRRLTREDKPSEHSGRLQWKRFVAAVPLVPLATAYVAVRLGWDVFELLVFCGIDVARHTSARSVEAIVAVSAWVHTTVAELARRLDAAQRLRNMVIAAVECTVVWLFHTAFPAIADTMSRAGRGIEAAVQWWERVDGATRLRDAIEALVLDGIIPTMEALQRTVVAVYRRTAWLVGRTIEAAMILGVDLIRDIRVLAIWAAAAVDWLCCEQRWWRDPLVHLLLARIASMCAERLRRIRHMLATHMVPRLIDALRVAWTLSANIAWACCRSVDALLQNALGTAVRVCGLLAPLSLAARLWLQRVDFLHPLARGLWTAGHHVCTIVRWLAHGLALAAALGVDAHAWAVAWILLPAARTVATIVVRLSEYIRLGAVWAARTIGGPLVVAICDVARTVETAISATWIAVQAINLPRVSWLWQWLPTVELELWIARGWALAMEMLAELSRASSYALWPALMRGWRDAARAMADVYAQLVSLVDSAVALVGDLIVEYARQSTVHTEQRSKSE
ncbi:hypothetical protein H4R27_005007 [Coemansia aciculifera]|nr:hypothetical protein H4R27_005007 [Coemansia aciculifera]